MKISDKLKILFDPKNLNTIKENELTLDVIIYALEHGFKYDMAIDKRYEKFGEYIIYNLKKYPEYIDVLLSEKKELTNIIDVKMYLFKLMNKDLSVFYKIIENTSEIEYLNEFKQYNSINDSDRKKIQDIVKNKYYYSELPSYLVMDNEELGYFYLNKDIDNIKNFIKYNKNFNVDRIVNLLMDSNYLKKYDVIISIVNKCGTSESFLERIVDKNINDITILFRLFNEIPLLLAPKYIRKLTDVIKDKVSMSDVPVNLTYEMLKDSEFRGFLKVEGGLFGTLIRLTEEGFNVDNFIENDLDYIRDNLSSTSFIPRINLPKPIIKIFDNNYYQKLITNTNADIRLGVIHQYDYEHINMIIEAIKQSRKNIKMVFPYPTKELKLSVLEKIKNNEIIYFEYTLGGKNELVPFDEFMRLGTQVGNILDLFVKDIKLSELSPFERYIAVYNIVKSFKQYKYYNDSRDMDKNSSWESRSIYKILLNNFIVCVGFSELLTSLLSRVGIKSSSYTFYEKRHQINYVNIKDEKYNIDGIFGCDVTSDNTIDTPLENRFDGIYRNISILPETPFDERVVSGNRHLPIDEYNVLNEIDDSFEDVKNKEGIDSYIKSNLKTDNIGIDSNKILQAIISVLEFNNGKNFTKEELRIEKSKIILENRFLFADQMINLEESLKNDLNKYKEELNNITYESYLQMPNSYKKSCFRLLIEEMIKNIKSCDDFQRISISFLDDIFFLNVILFNNEDYIKGNLMNQGYVFETNKDSFVKINLSERLRKELLIPELIDEILKVKNNIDIDYNNVNNNLNTL